MQILKRNENEKSWRQQKESQSVPSFAANKTSSKEVEPDFKASLNFKVVIVSTEIMWFELFIFAITAVILIFIFRIRQIKHRFQHIPQEKGWFLFGDSFHFVSNPFDQKKALQSN